MVKIIREAAGLTQSELAGKCDLSQGAIARFEKGRSTLSTDSLKRIARILDLKENFAELQGDIVFRQGDPDTPINLGISEKESADKKMPRDGYDDGVLKYVFAGQYVPEIRLLKPKSLSSKKLREGNTILAIAIRDSEKNYFFICEKKNAFLAKYGLGTLCGNFLFSDITSAIIL